MAIRNNNPPVAGHPGYEKTIELLQDNYWWPGMATPVQDYVTRCNTCQRFKGSNQAPAGLLQSLPISNTPWKHISADLITDFPLSHGYDLILAVINRLSKEVELIACMKTCSALDTTKLFLANVWKHHGLPHSITSDRGPQFTAQVMQELNKALSIATKLLSSFHLQVDGQTEIINKEIGKFL